MKIIRKNDIQILNKTFNRLETVEILRGNKNYTLNLCN